MVVTEVVGSAGSAALSWIFGCRGISNSNTTVYFSLVSVTRGEAKVFGSTVGLS